MGGDGRGRAKNTIYTYLYIHMCATAARYLWQKLPVVKEVLERF